MLFPRRRRSQLSLPSAALLSLSSLLAPFLSPSDSSLDSYPASSVSAKAGTLHSLAVRTCGTEGTDQSQVKGSRPRHHNTYTQSRHDCIKGAESGRAKFPPLAQRRGVAVEAGGVVVPRAPLPDAEARLGREDEHPARQLLRGISSYTGGLVSGGSDGTKCLLRASGDHIESHCKTTRY